MTSATTDGTPVTTSTGDVIWGDFRPGFFDPAPLAQLAEHMRDGRWLELRTDDGTLHRVRITEIRVYPKGDDIVLRQEWLTEKDEFRHREIVMDSEAIWRATPVKMRVSEVKPPVIERVGDPTRVLGEIVNVLIADTNFTTGELLNPNSGRMDSRMVDARHSGVLLLYEMTDLSTVEAAAHFGYKSQQPFLTARWKMNMGKPHTSEHHQRFAKDTKRRAREVWKRLGFPARRVVAYDSFGAMI